MVSADIEPDPLKTCVVDTEPDSQIPCKLIQGNTFQVRDA